jgi:membrane protease YdiL (CAAX protease family)
MGKLSIGSAALEGLRLIGRRPSAILAWALAYFLLGIVPAFAWAWHRAQLGAAHDNLAQSISLLTSSAQWVTLPASAVLYTAIYRAVLAPDQTSLASLRLGAAELRQFLLLLLRIGVIFALAFACAFGAGFAVGLGAIIPKPAGWVVQVTGVVVMLAAAIVVWLRLSMAPPMTFAEGRFRFFESWAFTRRRTGSLFALLLLVILTSIVVYLLFFVTLMGLLEVIAGMLRWRADQVGSVVARAPGVRDAPWLVVAGFAYSLLIVAVQCIATAPWARAYRALATKAGEAAAEPAPIVARAVAYGPLPRGARIGPAWSGPVILILAMGLAMGVLTVGLVLGLALARGGGAAASAQALNGWLSELGLSVGFDLLAVALLLLWTKRIERRPLASAGLGGRVGFGDIGWFLGGGIWAFVLALGLGMAAQVASAALTDPHALDGWTLPPEVWAQAPAVLVVIVLLAFSEEVMFRGWLISSLAPRTGIGGAVTISSLLFAAFHVMPWELGDPARLVSFLSYAAVGAGFSAVALGRGQIWSSTALHAGYNSFLAFATMVAQHATPQKLWGAVSEQRRGSADADQAFMTLGLNLAIAAVLIGLLLIARKPKVLHGALAVAAAVS